MIREPPRELSLLTGQPDPVPSQLIGTREIFERTEWGVGVLRNPPGVQPDPAKRTCAECGRHPPGLGARFGNAAVTEPPVLWRGLGSGAALGRATRATC